MQTCHRRDVFQWAIPLAVLVVEDTSRAVKVLAATILATRRRAP